MNDNDTVFHCQPFVSKFYGWKTRKVELWGERWQKCHGTGFGVALKRCRALRRVSMCQGWP